MEEKMTRASWSYRTYWQMMYDWLNKLSDAEIINIVKQKGIRINATGIDVAHRAATRIADKARGWFTSYLLHRVETEDCERN